MLTRVLAQELQQYNISVNELIPGPVETGRISETFRKDVVTLLQELKPIQELEVEKRICKKRKKSKTNLDLCENGRFYAH